MKHLLLIAAAAVFAIPPPATAADPTTIVIDGKPREVLVLDDEPGSILIATATGIQRLYSHQYSVPPTTAPPAPTALPELTADQYVVAALEIAAREQQRRTMERVAAQERESTVVARQIRQELRDLRMLLILQEASRRGLSLAVAEY